MTSHPPRVIVAVIDDDQRILAAIESLLESADFAVRLFASGYALLESDCLSEIDCLISDIDMPLMDGLALLQAVHGARPQLPIILITGYPDLLNRLPSISPIHYRCFRKPFDGQELLTALGEAVRRSPQP